MNRQMNEGMRVELGIWPIFAFLFGTPAVAATAATATTAATAAVAATTGFLTYTAIAGGTLMIANSLVQAFNRSESNPVSIPGMVAARGLSPEVATALQRQRTELEILQQEALKKQEELKKVEIQAVTKQKTENLLSKYGLFLVAGGVVLVTVLAVRKKRKK